VLTAILETFGAVRTSTLIRSRAVTTGKKAEKEPDYWNAALRFHVPSNWNPLEVLYWLLKLEKSLGRERAGYWAARTVDLDLLFWDGLFLDSSPELVLPHPLLPWRDFVLEPACEIAAEWVHPLTDLTLCEMRDAPKSPFVWDSMDPVPDSLVQKAKETHHAILAKRWICRNGEGEEVFEAVLETVKQKVGAA